MDDSFKNKILDVCSTSNSMREACLKLEMPYSTFKSNALALGCWKPNQGYRGTKNKGKILESTRLRTEDAIRKGINIFRPSSQLLIKLGIKKPNCERCGINSWNNELIVLELHHEDGNSKNNKIENLKILCPNCHSQTETFRYKKRSKEKMTPKQSARANKIKESKPLALRSYAAMSEEEINRRKKILSTIDRTKRGWKQRVSKEWGVSHSQVRRILEIYGW